MLPLVMTARSTLFAALAAVSVASLPAAPAHAWGDKEQSFVAGVATAVIISKILKENRRLREAPRAPGYSFVEPQPTASATSIYRTPAAQAFNRYSAAERETIQRNLRAWGYYRGGIDGSFGPGTYNAIAAFAKDEGASAKLGTVSGAFGVYDTVLF